MIGKILIANKKSNFLSLKLTLNLIFFTNSQILSQATFFAPVSMQVHISILTYSGCLQYLTHYAYQSQEKKTRLIKMKTI